MRRELPPRVSAYADPSGYDDRPRIAALRAMRGPSSGFCVRTCDGRFFPVQQQRQHVGGRDVQLVLPGAPPPRCSPAARSTTAVAPDGQRYADLDTAFLYRERTVENCTCNGKDTYGLVPLDVAADPTLTAGDIIATNDGLATYNGNRKSAEAAEFTPIAKSGGSSEWRLRLMSIKVTPAPPRAEPPVAAGRRKAAERTRPPTRSEIADHLVRQRQRRGQPRRFDPEQMDESRQAVLRRAFDHEVGRRFARTGQLRPDARIVRLQ